MSGFSGVISERDVLSVALLLVADLMNRDFRTVSADEDLKRAGALLLENGWECLPVVHDSKLVGILNHADFTRMVSRTGGVEKRAA